VGVVHRIEGATEFVAEGRRVRAPVPSGARAIPLILSALEERSFPVAVVTTARPSLDDVYLHYTGRDFSTEDQAENRIEFLTPGIVCMDAFFGSSWSGMAMITDLNRHVIDRFLAAPASRFAIVFSHGVALLVRKEASMIATANFVGLPLMFISAILIPPSSMPHWIAQLSRFNPVNWGVQASRNAIVGDGHWGSTGVYLPLLLAATAVTSLFATWCFRAYQRSI